MHEHPDEDGLCIIFGFAMFEVCFEFSSCFFMMNRGLLDH